MNEIRPCPVCKVGSVNTCDLHVGAVCNSCNRLVEVDFIFSVITPGIMLFSVIVCFSNELKAIGFLFVLLMVVYTSNIRVFNSWFLPLKSYGS